MLHFNTEHYINTDSRRSCWTFSNCFVGSPGLLITAKCLKNDLRSSALKNTVQVHSSLYNEYNLQLTLSRAPQSYKNESGLHT